MVNARAGFHAHLGRTTVVNGDCYLPQFLCPAVRVGVTDYDWNTLLDDHRASSVYMLFRTSWDQTNGSSEAYWRPKLACVAASFRDHDCAALLAA